MLSDVKGRFVPENHVELNADILADEQKLHDVLDSLYTLQGRHTLCFPATNLLTVETIFDRVIQNRGWSDVEITYEFIDPKS